METNKRKGLAEQQLQELVLAVQLLCPDGESRRVYKEAISQKLAKGRPEMKVVQAVLHLLYTRINGRAAAKKDLRVCWPITESNQQKEFKKVMEAWVRALAGAGRLPPQTAKYFITAYQTWGNRTVELLFHLAVLALEAHLERGFAEALTTVAPGLQDADAAAYDLARAEDRQRKQAEWQRLQEILAVVQRAQQLFAVGVRSCGGEVQQLQPWWPTSQAHAEKVQALQQIAKAEPHWFGADSVGSILDALMCPSLADARGIQELGSGGADACGANPAGIAQVVAARMVPGVQPAGRLPDARVHCPTEDSRVATDRLHLRALVLELDQAVQLQAASSCGEQACRTPCSVLQFLPPSPPRGNPVLEALRSAAGTPNCREAPLPGTSSGSVQEARQGVWAAVRSRRPASPPQGQPPAAAMASCAAGASPCGPGVELSLPPPVRLQATGQLHSSPAPAASAGDALLSTPQGQGTLSSQWGSRLHLAALPSPTLSQMVESAMGSPFLFSLSSSSHGESGASSGGPGDVGGFSLPPSLPLTPRWDASPLAQPPCAAGQGHGQDAPAQQPSQQQQQQQPQPDSPCFAESIASFCIVGGASSAEVVAGAQGSRLGEGRLRAVQEAISPSASVAAIIVPVQASHPGSTRDSLVPAVQPSASGADATASYEDGGHPALSPAAAAAQPSNRRPAAEVLGEAATPESKAPRGSSAADGGMCQPDSCTPSSLPEPRWAAVAAHAGASAPDQAVAGGRPLGDAGRLDATPLSGRGSMVQLPGISAPEPLDGSPSPAPAARCCSTAATQQLPSGAAQATASHAGQRQAPAVPLGGSPGPGFATGRRLIPCVVTTSSPTKIKPLPVAVPGSPAGQPMGSPGASECSRGTLYSPPKALASPAGAIGGRSSATLQDVSNSAGRSGVAGQGKSDLGTLLQRMERLRSLKQKQ